jgi:hypothetical protein
MQKSGTKEISATQRAITIGRWIAFLPAAWMTGYVHNWILRAFGVPVSSNVIAASDSDLLAFGVAGLLTPICVIAAGALVCPTKGKAFPILTLSAVLVLAGSRRLSQSTISGLLWRPFGLDSLLIVSVPALVAIAYAVLIWRSSQRLRAP